MEEKNPLAFQTVRYGLPAVVLIFYLTASMEIQYTPDSSYLFLQVADACVAGRASPEALRQSGGTPSPLWIMLVAAGRMSHLDSLLTIKIFSLLFSSGVALCAFLLAVEIVGDRLIGLTASLCAAMQAWLLQTAPSGSALPAGLLLTLAAIFFLLRNEYLLASFFAGLSTLVFWQAAVLMGLLCADVLMNSKDKGRGAKVAVVSLVSFLCPLLVWLIVARANEIPVLPVLIPFVELSTGDIVGVGALTALALLAVLGILPRLHLNTDTVLALRSHFVPLLWVAWLASRAMTGRIDLGLLAVPLLVIYGFRGLVEILRATHRQRLMYPAALVLAGLLLVQSQGLMAIATRPTMEFAQEKAQRLMTIAYWLRAHDPVDKTIEAEEPGIVGFYSGMPVRFMTNPNAPTADLIVTSAPNVDGYDVAFAPQETGMDLPTGISFAVWKRK